MAGNLRDHVAEQFRQRKAERDISSALIDQGYTPDYVEQLIRDVKQDLPGLYRQRDERIQQQKAEQSAENRKVRRYEQSRWLLTVLAGIGLIILGTVVTGVTYQMAEPGGTFIVTSGVIFVGVLLLLKGLYHRLRWW